MAVYGMTTKTDYLSDNAILILDEIFENKDLMKLIYYDKTPLDNPDINNKEIVLPKYLSPIPFADGVPVHQGCELRAWFVGGQIKNRVILDSRVAFQFIFHKDTSLITIDGKPKIRFYEVINQILQTFDGKAIGTLGRLSFEDQSYVFYDAGKDHGVYQIQAKMITL